MTSITLIVPAGGKSTRFPGVRPKWQLTHPNGDLMLVEAIAQLQFDNIARIVITVIQDHLEGLQLEKVRSRIEEIAERPTEFLILDHFTQSQCHTIYETITKLNITGPIFIKDCDNFFQLTPSAHNAVSISELTADINATNKSYVLFDGYNINSIVEKKVISNLFCVGGYSFKEATDFTITFEKEQDEYLSTIIQKMLLNGHQFKIETVKNYIDVGTLDDWQKYVSNFRTLLIDLDGVLINNSSEYFDPIWGIGNGIIKNIETIKLLFNSRKTHIIITTSRKEEYKEQTIQQLNKLGILYHSIIFNLPHCKRILINDFSDSNPFPTASAINLRRNFNDLNEYLLEQI